MTEKIVIVKHMGEGGYTKGVVEFFLKDGDILEKSVYTFKGKEGWVSSK